MPTKDEIEELLDSCTWTWTAFGPYTGYKVTSKINGNSIILPSTGYQDGPTTYGTTKGYYWSSTAPGNTHYAYYLYFTSDDIEWKRFHRQYGRSVRPVSD